MTEASPTQCIRDFARLQPGGVIRWREARDCYLCCSHAPRRDERMGMRNYHVHIGQVLKRHFTKVEGTDGYYVLTETIAGED